jgi:hypothetical protein
MDLDGKRVDRRKEYYQYYRSVDEGIMGSFRSGIIKPHETYVHRFRLLEVYDMQNPSDSSLKVRWDRGFDGRGNRYPVDRNLAVELKLPTLRAAGEPVRTTTAPPAPTQLSDSKGALEVVGQNPPETPSSKAKTDGMVPPPGEKMRWIVGGGVFALVVIVLLAIAWCRKGRS